jgi:predicted metallo-beta-lactamase superfamily hydrolase
MFCPAELPAGYTGQYYEQNLTFYLPANFDDPGTGVSVTLIDVVVSSVAGLPYGFEFTINDADSTYHPSDGDTLGCATVCGIPLLPGTYNVVITIDVLAEAFGFEITQVQTYSYTVVIIPGEGSAASFTWDNSAACNNLSVNYEATVVGPEPSVTSYSWDFGNGIFATGANPPIVLYNEVGDYDVVLTTTVSELSLNTVSVSDLSGAWGNDLDDFLNSADPYFILTDGNSTTIYSSEVISNTTSTTWSGINILLSNPPYTITFFDSDDLSVDDALGAILLPLENGFSPFDAQNGTVGTTYVGLQVTSEFSDTTTVSVFPVPNPSFIITGNTLSIDDPNLVTFVWYLNGEPIANAFAPTFDMQDMGNYSCVVTNAFGCQASTDEYLYCPEITPVWDNNTLTISVDNFYTSYQWYFNGILISGATTWSLTNPSPGNYTVQAISNLGCTTTSQIGIVPQSIAESKKANDFVVFPIPVVTEVNMACESCRGDYPVKITDSMGNIVLETIVSFDQSGGIKINISALSAGVYFLHFQNQKKRFLKL